MKQLEATLNVLMTSKERYLLRKQECFVLNEELQSAASAEEDSEAENGPKKSAEWWFGLNKEMQEKLLLGVNVKAVNAKAVNAKEVEPLKESPRLPPPRPLNVSAQPTVDDLEIGRDSKNRTPEPRISPKKMLDDAVSQGSQGVRSGRRSREERMNHSRAKSVGEIFEHEKTFKRVARSHRFQPKVDLDRSKSSNLMSNLDASNDFMGMTYNELVGPGYNTNRERRPSAMLVEKAPKTKSILKKSATKIPLAFGSRLPRE